MKIMTFMILAMALVSQAQAATMNCTLTEAGGHKDGNSNFDLKDYGTIISKSSIDLETSEYKAEAFFNGSDLSKIVTDKSTGVQAIFEANNALSASNQRLLPNNGAGYLMKRTKGGPDGLGNQVWFSCEIIK